MTDINLSNRNKRTPNRNTSSMKTFDVAIQKFILEAREFNQLEVSWIQLLDTYEVEFDCIQIPDLDFNEELVVQEFLLSFYGIRVKPMTVFSIARWNYYQNILNLCKTMPFPDQYPYLPYLFITKKFKKIHRILDFYKLKDEECYNTWKVWSNLFENKKSAHKIVSSCIYSKIGEVYGILLSNTWSSYNKSIGVLRSHNLKDLESIIHADIILYKNSTSEEQIAVSLLTSSLMGKYGVLAFLRLLKHYLDYNMHPQAQMLCLYITNKFAGEFADLARAFLIKVQGKMKRITVPRTSDSLLCHYYFLRSCIKYNLRPHLGHIIISFNLITKQLQNIKFYVNMFDIKVFLM